jgi:hypothetical protein
VSVVVAKREQQLNQVHKFTFLPFYKSPCLAGESAFAGRVAESAEVVNKGIATT